MRRNRKTSVSHRATDAVHKHAPQPVRLRGRRLRVEVHESDVRLWWSRYGRTVLALTGVFIVGVGVWYFGVRSAAQVAEFHPGACLGGWSNPTHAQGPFDVPWEGDRELFTTENSAVLENASADLFCGSFSGTVPAGAEPTKVTLQLSLLLTNDEPAPQPPQGIPSESEPDANPPAEPAPTEPTSFFERMGLFIAFAQEDAAPAPDPAPESEPEPEPEAPAPEPTPDPPPPLVMPPTEPDATTSAPEEAATSSPEIPIETPSTEPTTTPSSVAAEEEPSPEPAIFEVLFSGDGETWRSAGTITATSWRTAEFRLPQLAWDDLTRLQIHIRSVPNIEGPYTAYLDGMRIAVEYETPAEEELAAEPVLLPEGQDARIATAVSAYYYYIFSPQDIAVDGGYCAFLTGAEVIEKGYNLKNEGTCFINDPGVFEVLELSAPTTGTYKEFKRSEHLRSVQQIYIPPRDATSTATGTPSS